MYEGFGAMSEEWKIDSATGGWSLAFQGDLQRAADEGARGRGVDCDSHDARNRSGRSYGMGLES